MLFYGISCYVVRKLPYLLVLWKIPVGLMLYLTPPPCVLPALPSDAYITRCYI